MQNNPKVSVCVVTYNHEKYIKECLESIVTQKCDFDFEVIVGEDCSTDNTRAIVQEYADKYPNIIKPMFHEKNVGASDNYFLVHNQARGEYICHIDGDDYALPGKLQAQADFMDKTPDCNICFHRVKILFPDGTLKDDLVEYEKIKNGFTKELLASIGSIGYNSSKMYRKELVKVLNPFSKYILMDFAANIIQVSNKKIMYCNENIYGVYRANVGAMVNNKKIIDIRLKNLEILIEHYPDLKQYINTYVLTLFLADLKNLRKSTIKHFLFCLNTFSIKSFSNFLVKYNYLKYFKIP